MDKISTLLVPFDFSLPSKIALDYAVDFVGFNAKMKIVVAHITENGELEDTHDKFKIIKEGYSRTLRAPMELVSKSGTLTNSILDIQKTQKIDLIIMGTSGASDEKKRTVTHTSELVKEADCPVLVVPENIDEFQIKNIALVLGKDEIDDREALGTLLDVARKFNAKVHVLTIENEPGTYGYSPIDEKNENLLEYYLESFYSHHIFIENEDVVEGITTYVADKEIDMIAILPRNHARRSSPSEGKLTQELTLHSKVPLLTID